MNGSTHSTQSKYEFTISETRRILSFIRAHQENGSLHIHRLLTSPKDNCQQVPIAEFSICVLLKKNTKKKIEHESNTEPKKYK